MSYVDTICWRMTEFHFKLRFDVKDINKQKNNWWSKLTYREKIRHSFIWFTRQVIEDPRDEMENYYELLLKNAYFFAPAVGGGAAEIIRKLKPKLISPSSELLNMVVGHKVDVDEKYFPNHEVSRYWGISIPKKDAVESVCKIDLPVFGTVDVAGVIYNGLEERIWLVYRRNKEQNGFFRYGMFSDEDCRDTNDKELYESFERVKNLVKNVIVKYDKDRLSGVKEEVILPPAGSKKTKTWDRSHGDSRSLFKPTSLKAYIRVGRTKNHKKKDESKSSTTKSINFSHRVVVSGHYRNLSNLTSFGKDEFTGERNQKGKTWVMPHERGGRKGDVVIEKTENIHLS